MSNSELLAMMMGQTPESRRREAAAQMLMNIGNRPPPRTWMEGLTQGIGSLGSAYITKQGADQDEADQQGFQSILRANQGKPNSALMEALAASDNPVARQVSRFNMMSPLLADPAKPENLGQPTTVIGPDGKPQLVQFGNRGTAQPVGGFSPPPSTESAAGWKEVEPGNWVNMLTGERKSFEGVYDRSVAKARAGATNVNTQVSPTQIYTHEEGAGMQEMFKGLGTKIDSIQGAASTTASTASRISQLNKELEGIPTGMGAEARTMMLQALKATGLSDEAANRELAKREAAGRQSGEMVMEQLNAMKGPATEKEREYLQAINPGMSTTPQGRAEMELLARHQAQRAREAADATAEVANAVQRRELPIGDAQRMVRERVDQINKKYDEQLGKSPAAPAPSAAPAQVAPKTAPAPAPTKKIKIDVNGNIIP